MKSRQVSLNAREFELVLDCTNAVVTGTVGKIRDEIKQDGVMKTLETAERKLQAALRRIDE